MNKILKKLFIFLFIILGLFTITACGNNKDNKENKQEDNTVEEEDNNYKTVVDDGNIKIEFIRRDLKKVPGMMNNQKTVFNLPVVVLQITNKMDQEIHLGVHTSKTIDNTIDYAFSLSNSDGVKDSTGFRLAAKSKGETTIYYEKIRDLEDEYPLSSFDDMIIYLELYVDENKNIKSYELDGNELK